MYRSNAFESNLMSVDVIKSEVHIASIPKHFLTKKEIAAKSFSEILGIYIPILLKNIVAEALNFSPSKLNIFIKFLIFISTLKQN